MRVRHLNGYRLVYLPKHPRAMTSKNWLGFIYEHIVVAEAMLGRALKDNEEVHHLDENRSNNRAENLIVLEKSQLLKLHNYLRTSASVEKSADENGVNSGKPKLNPFCPCGNILLKGQKRFCSRECARAAPRKTKVLWPSREQLAEDLVLLSWVAIGRKYGVSDNAVRKWAKKYGIDKATLSQAESTLSEGAETTGEVKSS